MFPQVNDATCSQPTYSSQRKAVQHSVRLFHIPVRLRVYAWFILKTGISTGIAKQTISRPEQ